MSKKTYIISGEADGANAIAHELDTITSLSTDGAKLWSIKNAGIEKIFVDKDGFLDGHIESVLTPTATPADIAAAITAVSDAGGGIVTLMPGEYTINSIINPIAPSNVIIRGSGESTILRVTGSTTSCFSLGGVAYETDINNSTVETKSFVCTTPGDASNFLIGEPVFLYGDDEIDETDDYEFNIVAANGNTSSGEVELKYRLSRNMTSARVARYRGGQNIVFQDFKIISETASTTTALYLTRTVNCAIKRVSIETEGSGKITSGSILYAGAMMPKVEDCKITNLNATSSSGIQLVQKCLLGKISGNTIRGLPEGGVPIIISACVDILIDHNVIKSNSTGTLNGYAIHSDAGKRIFVTNNILQDAGQAMGIWLYGQDSHVQGNIIHNTAERPGLNYQAIRVDTNGRAVISGNHIRHASNAIILQATSSGDPSIIAGNQCYDTIGTAIRTDGAYCIISGNMINVAATGIDCGAQDNTSVNNNILKGITGSGIVIQADAEGVIVSNNRIISSVTGIYLIRSGINTVTNSVVCRNFVIASGVALNLNGVSDSIICNNTFNGTSSDITLDDAAQAIISDNIISNNDMHGGGLTTNNKGTGNDLSHNREF